MQSMSKWLGLVKYFLDERMYPSGTAHIEIWSFGTSLYVERKSILPCTSPKLYVYKQSCLETLKFLNYPLFYPIVQILYLE